MQSKFIWGCASENNIEPTSVVFYKILEIGTHEVYRTLYVLKLRDVYNYDLFKLIKVAMNDRFKLFEEFYKPHLSLKKYYTRNSRFYRPSVRLDVGRNFIIFQRIKCLILLLPSLCAHV